MRPSFRSRSSVVAAATALVLLGGVAYLGFGPDASRAAGSSSDAAAGAGLDLTTANRGAEPADTSDARTAVPSSRPKPRAIPKSSTRTTAPKAATSKSSTTRAKPRQSVTTKPSTIKPSTTKPSTTKPVSQPSGSAASQVITLVNAERAKAGCGALRQSSQLAAAAYGHSKDMAAKDYFSHVSQDGRTFDVRIHAAGYSGGTLGENIAAGQSTASAVMQSWMNSSGHRANILNCAFKQIGVGVARGGSYGIYWTQDFGG